MSTIVETSYGKLEGVEQDGLAVFRGIPFARPPVGELRYRAPQRAERWEGVRDASQFGAACPQGPRAGAEQPVTASAACSPRVSSTPARIASRSTSGRRAPAALSAR